MPEEWNPSLPGRYALAVLPYSTLSPAACGAIGVALEEAIEQLVDLEVISPVIGRAREAVRQLQQVAESGSYGATEEELHLTARAVFLANDLYTITRALPQQANPLLRGELAQIARGALDEDSTEQRGYAVQTQFWAGTLLAHARLNPGIPAAAGTRPDFIVTLEGVRIGVEVKRPLNELSAFRAIDHAGAQLRDFGLSGFIVGDLSEALGTRHLTVLPHSVGPTARDMIRPEFTRLATSLEHHVTGSQPASHTRTIGMITYARHCAWLPGNRRSNLMRADHREVSPSDAMGYPHPKTQNQRKNRRKANSREAFELFLCCRVDHPRRSKNLTQP